MDEIDKYRKEKRKAERKGNLKEASQFCNFLGELLAKQGRYEEAIEEHQQELLLCEALQDMIGVAVANRKIGECYSEKGHFTKALEHQRRHLQIAQSEGDDVETQRAFATIGRTYLFKAESTKDVAASKEALERARSAFQQSLDCCEKLESGISRKEYAEMKSRLLLNIGIVLEQKGNIKRASELLKQAIQISQTHNLKEDLYRCQHTLAEMFKKHGHLGQAIRLYDMALKYCQSVKDKVAEVEILTQKSLIYVQLGDLFAAQRAIRKVYKSSASSEDTRERASMIFKTVIVMDRLMETLKKTPEDDYESRMVIYEKMGDRAAQVESFKQAIASYQNMLKCAIALCKTGTELIPVYVSLAQTYVDDKQYSSAVEYFHKELECWADDNEQKARTWLNIANAEELAGETYIRVKESYTQAMNQAKEARNKRLQLLVLKSLAVSQDSYGKTTEREETDIQIQVMKDMYGLSSDNEDDLSEAEGSQNIVSEEDINLEDYLSDSDASDDEEYDRSKSASGRTARRKSKAQIKRNEKGETPLHRACIEGNLKKVKALLAQNHPVNPRDYCGWIPLHEAANHNYVDIVEALLEAGAWLNDRGGQQCGGVTPLHDACNCGNVEVVRLLVARGANVHAKDDEGNSALNCLIDYIQRSQGGLTAQELGELEAVARLLKDTLKGNNPHLSETLNPAFKKSPVLPGIDDSQDSKMTHRQRRDYKSREAPPNMDSQDSDIDIYLHSLKSSSSGTRRNKRRRNLIDDDDDENDIDNKNDDDDDDDDDDMTPYRSRVPQEADLTSSTHPSAACNIYQSAIATMRRSAVSAGITQSAAAVSRQPRPCTGVGPALLNAEECVGDDWLVDDIGPTGKPAKRKRTDVDTIFTTTGTRRSDGSKRYSGSGDQEDTTNSPLPNTPSRDQGQSSGVDSDSENVARAISPVLDLWEGMDDSEMTLCSDPNQCSIDEFPSQKIPVTSATSQQQPHLASQTRHTQGRLSTKPPRQTKLSTFGLTSKLASQAQPKKSHVPSQSFTSSTPDGENMANQSSIPARPVMRLKVKIKERCILVPIPNVDRTVGWLTQEAAERYYKLYNMRPLLVLATKDGAVLSSEDPVTFILTDNEELEGQVVTWDLPPLPNRYADACATQKSVRYVNVENLLTDAVSTQTVMLADLALHPTHFVPICKALQCQTSLRELHINGNRLGDDGFSSLCDVLHTLPNLRVANFAANQITATGLRCLASILDTHSEANTETALQILEKLNLGFNPLGDASTQSLASVVRHLPGLSSLTICSCDFTMRFFQQHRMSLADAFSSSGLSELDVSCNLLGSTGVELLLRCVRPPALTSLNLSGVLASYTTNHIHKHLHTYLLQPGAALARLVLDGCYLLPELWPEITGLVAESGSLEHLSLSANPKLANTDIEELLEAAARSDRSKLSVLVFNGCQLSGPLSTTFIDAINDKLLHRHPLQHVQFTCARLSALDADTVRQVWTARWLDDARCCLAATVPVGKVTLSTVEMEDRC